MLADPLDQLHLFLRCQLYCGLNNISQGDVVKSNEAVVIHVGEKSHNELTVHTVGNATMPWNRISEVLDLEGSLQPRREEATKRRNERSKSRKDQNVELHWSDAYRRSKWEPDWQRVLLCQEYWVHFAVESSPDVCSKVVHRADEVVVSHEHIREEDTEDDREDPRANEALYCLLWGQLNELSASESYTTKVCEDVVANDKGNWQKEPDHPFEDVVHNKMRLDNDKIERHMRPCKLGELESVVAGLKGCDEENEAYREPVSIAPRWL